MGAGVGVGKGSNADTRYLVRHNGHLTWHCVKDVPKALRAAVGHPRLVASLRTHDIAVARSRRWEVLAEFERILSAARAQTGGSRAIDAGMAWRGTLARIEANDPAIIRAFAPQRRVWADHAEGSTDQAQARLVASDALEIVADDLSDEDRAVFMGVALGRVTPLLHHVDAWLAEGGAKGPLKPRTAAQYRHDVGRLESWAKRTGLPLTVEAFDRRAVGRYVTETIVAAKVDPATGNRWVSAASAYWRWMVKRAGIETNPWTGASLAKSAIERSAQRSKRPFTDDEMVALLNGNAGSEIADLVRVAALSGMRLEEIYRLQVRHCANGWFQVCEAKTRAGLRRVPVHSDLSDLIASRIKAKAASDFLFHEPGPPKPGRERSAGVSKRFGRYRQSVAVHERAEGKRHSRIDFHSLRRWFVTAARQHFDQPTVAAVVGHEAGNITDDIYSAGPNDDRKRAVVECVRLPTAGVTTPQGS